MRLVYATVQSVRAEYASALVTDALGSLGAERQMRGTVQLR